LNPAHKNHNHLQNKALTKNTESVSASCLAHIVQKYPDLAAIAKAWPDLPEHIKQAIKALIQTHEAEKK